MSEDESLYADILANGDTLGYRLLKGLQLPIDCPADKLVAPTAQLTHDLDVVSFLSFFFNFFFSSLFFLHANNSVVEPIEQYVEYQRALSKSTTTIGLSSKLLRLVL